MTLRWSLFFSVLLLATAATAQDEEAGAARQELETLRERIAAISAGIRETEAERGRIAGALRETELALAAIAGRIERIASEIRTGERRQEVLREQERDVRERLETQQRGIRGAVREAWQLGDEAPLKLLLNLEDPATVARQMTYLRYLLSDRQAVIDRYRDDLAELGRTRDALDRAAAELRSQREELEQQRSRRDRERAQRASLIASLDAELEQQGSTLLALERDRETLEALLEQLEEAVAAAPNRPPSQPFSEARGAMPWPVDGRLANRFGRARNRGKMQWQGVNLLAEAGTTVRAIHDGRVVYADWLRGSGLLLVIDHGEDYLSLYAHNESLLREVGEWVAAGAPIATVGDSGGQPQPALYFEIRKGGDPVDPALWCRR